MVDISKHEMAPVFPNGIISLLFSFHCIHSHIALYKRFKQGSFASLWVTGRSKGTEVSKPNYSVPATIQLTAFTTL